MSVKNRRFAGGGKCDQASSPVAYLFATAVAHHRAGGLREAQDCYRQALAFDPKHAPSLQCLGVLAHQTGNHAAAVDLIGKAIALDGDNADSHYNITLPLHALGRIDDVIDHCRRAIALKPDYAEAHLNLGNALRHKHDLPRAAACYRRVLELRPDASEAHFNLANVMAEQGKVADALAGYERALALDPTHAWAHNNLGTALIAQGQPGEAVEHFQAAVRHDPNLAQAYINLGATLLRHGKLHDALGVINRMFEIGAAERQPVPALDLVRRALAIEESDDTRTLFVQCVRSLSSVPDLDYVRAFLLRALDEPWGRPADLAPAATSLLQHDGVLGACIARAAQAWPRRLPASEMLGEAGWTALTQNRLLRSLLVSTPIRSVAMERFLTAVRLALLEAARGEWDAELLPFACALARHCFINDYAFDCTESEAAEAARLGNALAESLRDRRPVATTMLAAVACYTPLHSLAGAERLLDQSWPEPVRDLLDVQVEAPRRERELRASIPALTAIDDGVSQQVRAQYEQNPYPRWVKTARIGAPARLDDYLAGKFPEAGFRALEKPTLDMLVAGCGTGQHATTVALQFKDMRILAIDLSLASLCYAKRTTQRLGLDIDYAQADILALGSVERRFDLIDSSGVLHHLADPFAGWRILLSLLHPRGVMRLGFYSALGRAEVDAVRRHVAERGFRPLAEEIRKCRQELMGYPEGTPQRAVTLTSDFFSLSECRDLLFHVQERSLTLPEIKAFLEANALKFLGFETSEPARQLYAHRFPRDSAMADLDRWCAVESEAPRTFLNMYQFWVQRCP